MDMSWTCPFVLVFGFNCYSSRTLSDLTLVSPMSSWSPSIWVMSNLIAAKVKSIEPNASILCSNVLYHSWMHLGRSTSLHWHIIFHANNSMFWCCLHEAYVLSILCPVIWCPCPEMITHYWCNVQDMSRPCPGHVLDVSSKLSIWSFFGHALEGQCQLSLI